MRTPPTSGGGEDLLLSQVLEVACSRGFGRAGDGHVLLGAPSSLGTGVVRSLSRYSQRGLSRLRLFDGLFENVQPVSGVFEFAGFSERAQFNEVLQISGGGGSGGVCDL